MERIAALKSRYAQYEQEAREVKKNAPPFAGFWGWGDDPRNDPCHARFYEDVGAWTANLAASRPDGAVVYEAARWLLLAPAECGEKEARWFQYAAQGHCKLLIPLLSREQCGALADLFDQYYPRRERLPVQTELYKLLKKGR